MQDEIKIEDLHPTYQMIARIIGIENALKLGREIGGEALYLPKLDSNMSPLLKLRNKRICAEFNGSNIMQLGRKYNVTSTRIYAILREERRARKKLTEVV